MIGIAPPIALKVDPNDHTKRVEKSYPLGIHTARWAKGKTRALDVWTVGGAPVETVIDVNGDRTFLPLEKRQRQLRPNRASCRLYCQYRTHDGAVLTIRYHRDKTDNQRKFNRAENLRPVPPGTDEYKRLYGRRNDTESANRQREDALWQKRATCYGRVRTFISSLAWAIGENAICRFVVLRTT